MSDEIRSLRRQLAVVWGVLALTFFTAAAGSLHPLYLANATNQPTTPINLAGGNWTGVLDGARLPALGPLLSGGSGTLNLNGYTLSLPAGSVVNALGRADLGVASLTASGDVSGLNGFFSYVGSGGGSYVAATATFDGTIISNGAVYAGGDGVILYSPDSWTAYQVSVDERGNLSTTPY